MTNGREKHNLKSERFVRITCFLTIFAILFICIQKIVTPKWLYVPEVSPGETNRYQSFYELDNNTLDYIVLGASTSYHSINPMLIYAETGYTEYNLGSPYQGIKVSLYWLKEALKYQKPKYVFYDASSLLYESTVSSSDTNEASVTKALTNMRFSWNKIQACFECRTRNKESIEYLLPILSFHTRWDDLEKEDFYFGTNLYVLKGAYLKFKVRNDSSKEEINTNDYKRYDIQNTEVQYEKRNISEENRAVFEELLSLCRENDIELIPTRGLTKSLGVTDKKAITDFLNEYGLQYMDFGSMVSVDWNRDTL